MVVLDVQRPELRAQLISALTEIGVQWCDTTTDDPAATAILREVGSSPSPLATRRKLPVVHLWETGRRPDGGVNAFAQPDVRHLVGVKPEVDILALSSTLHHIRTGKFLGLAGVLQPDATIHTLYETTSANKQSHLQQFGTFLRELGTKKVRGQILEMALEEMYTNAVFDAPTTTVGEHSNASANRSQSVSSKRPFVIMYGADRHHVGVAVRDYYGSITQERVIGRLRECYVTDGAKHETKQGGAGLGLFMMLRNADRLIINVSPNQFTELVVLARHTRPMRESRNACPTFNLCAVSSETAAKMRRHFRMTTSWNARLINSGPTGGEPFHSEGVVRDISVWGAFVQTRHAVTSKRGDVLSINIQVAANQAPFSLRGVVRWMGRSATHRCDGIGIQLERPLSVLDAYGREKPGRITTRERKHSVAKIIQTWVTGGTHPGEPVTVYFRVLDERGNALLLRHDTLTGHWAMKVPSG